MKTSSAFIFSPYSKVFLAFIGVILISNAHAVGSAKRTFSGTDGVLNTFFNQCTGCHSGDGVGAGLNWDVYSQANSNYGNSSTGIYYRVFITNDAPMYGGNAANQSHLTGWNTDGRLNFDAPYIATGSNGSNSRIGTNNYSKGVSFTVNENGANTTFTAYYRKGADSWSSVSSSSPAGTGGGDSGSNTTSSATLTNLVCGNTYTYYLSGTNSGGTSSGLSGGNTNTFSITCNTGASISGSPGTATEDSLFQWTPTKTAGTGGADTLTYSFSSGPSVTGGNTSNLPSINSSTGQISWTPTEGNTSSNFTILVSDSSADTSITDTLAVTINANAIIDNDPIITTASIPTGTEDTTNYSIQFTATDADTVDTQTWSITSESDPQMSITTGGLFTWSPLEGEAGAHSVSIRVTDSGARTDTNVYNFTINPDNENPVITTSTAGQAVNEDSLYSLDLDASDGDIGSGDVASQVWSITSPVLPYDGMAIASGTGVLTWTPTTEADLVQSVTVLVTDGLGGTDSATFNITVTAIADNNPVITTSSMPGATQNQAYSHTLAYTDADTDGDSWTWSIASGPTVQPANAAPTNAFNLDTSTGEVTWTPANNETSLAFTARVTDSRGNPYFDDQALTISVADVNYAPSISNTPIATQNATENSPFSIDLDATDPDTGDTQAWSIRLPASKPDDMAIDSNGVLTWTPTSDVSFTQSVTVRVTDSGNLNNEVTFNIDVTPVIDNAPIITSVQGDLPTNTREDIQSFSHTLTWTDADTEGDGWTWSLTAQDDPDIAINPSTGEITWAPVEGERGDFNLTARVTDDGGFWDDIALVITVLKDNEAPIITGTPIATQNATEDVQFSIDLNFTDTDIGDTEAWAITSPVSLPDDMAISNTGVLTWTPSEGIDRTQAVTVQVTDEGGLTDSTSFSIDVDSVNDAPVLTQVIPDDSVEEHSAFSYSVQASDSDPQDNPFNANHTFSITNVSPTPNSAGPQIDSTGQITWTPGNNDARTVNPAALSQDYVVSVSVADGGEDSQAAATQDFTLTVTLQDADADTVPDYEDNCVNTANTDQANNDGDASGDLCDPDDDNDGVSDIAENANPPMDAFLNTDAAGDVDSDGLTNLAEFNTCTGSDINSLDTCPSISIDSVPPTITHNGDFDITAKGYTTFVDFKATASDGNDGAVEVYASSTQKNLRPGDHVITWTAQDQIPNIAELEQIITIHPIVTLGSSQVLAENASGEIVIHFNGDVPLNDFPLQITYSLSGTSNPSDYLIDIPSPITINDPSEIIEGKFTLYIDILSGDATESPETLTITLSSVSGGPVLGTDKSHQILIIDGQVAPIANLIATQNAIDTNFIFGDQGIVTVNANASDGNLDPLTFDWSNSDATLSGTPAGGSFSFNPASLVIAPEDLPRVFRIAVSVSDGTATINKQIFLSYQADTFALPSSDTDGDGINDDIEGLADSDNDGIPDYLDAFDNPPNLLFAGNNTNNDSLPAFIQAEAGTTITLGEFSLSNNTGSPKLNMTTLSDLGVTESDVGFVHWGSIYEFVITGLSQIKPSARVVIPLENNIPPGAVYRKFDGTQWFTFVEGANDSISSAISDENGCPVPGSDSYQAGLLPFRDCVQLQLSDGGANDNDGEANGTIVDPGGLALSDNAELFEPQETIDESAQFGSNGPSSSGLLHYWFILFLGLCAGLLKLKKIRK